MASAIKDRRPAPALPPDLASFIDVFISDFERRNPQVVSPEVRIAAERFDALKPWLAPLLEAMARHLSAKGYRSDCEQTPEGLRLTMRLSPRKVKVLDFGFAADGKTPVLTIGDARLPFTLTTKQMVVNRIQGEFKDFVRS